MQRRPQAICRVLRFDFLCVLLDVDHIDRCLLGSSDSGLATETPSHLTSTHGHLSVPFIRCPTSRQHRFLRNSALHEVEIRYLAGSTTSVECLPSFKFHCQTGCHTDVNSRQFSVYIDLSQNICYCHFHFGTPMEGIPNDAAVGGCLGGVTSGPCR